ncbi:MAG: histidine phosphatase family protein [Lachnospiraceae bacterium]|jgi:broad specificity phosphatase PhoE
MKLYVMRHGETTWNTQWRLQGSSDTHLNENGREMAAKTGKGLKDIRFDLCFTSPLHRARETAELVLGDPKIPIIADERLREISFGEWEGKSTKGPNSPIPRDMLYCFFHKPEDYIPPKGGESLESLCHRTGMFLEEVISNPENRDKNILITSHGCAARGVMQKVYGNTGLADFWHGTTPPNCSMCVVEVNNGSMQLLEEDVIYYECDSLPEYVIE